MSEAILLYRGSCRRCRWLARMAVIASAGSLRRVALDSEAAARLYELYPATRGKLALIDGERFWCGLGVVPAAARLTAGRLLRRFL
jgi:predicted DCC family thiol-disulfide oxidoreductase YuxK